MDSMLLEFSGKIYDKDLYTYLRKSIPDNEISERELLKRLQKSSKYISYKIKSNIIKETGLNCDAVVSFSEGCIEWNGFIEVFYDSLEVFATIGGAIGFVQLVKSSINSTISDSFSDSVSKIYSINKKRSVRIEPTFDIDTKVKNVTATVGSTKPQKETYEPLKQEENTSKEKNNSLLHLVLILSVIANIVAFVALALSLVWNR